MRKTLAIIIATFLVTALGVLLVATLSLGNKQVDRRIDTLYTVADPQFLRSMGSLLGPPIVDGNRALALVNGNEIFPAMRKPRRITLEEWENRPWSDKLLDGLAGLFSSQL